MLAMLAAHNALPYAPRAYESNGDCWVGDECSPPVDIYLTDQGWGAHIVYTVALHVDDWRSGSEMSVLVSGAPSLLSVGHPSGCRVVQSGEASFTVELGEETSDTCSAVISASRVRRCAARSSAQLERLHVCSRCSELNLLTTPRVFGSRSRATR